MSALDRLDAAMILGSRLWICRIGTEVTSGEGSSATTTAVSDSFVPEPPASLAQPGAWTPLGKLRSFKPQTDYKQSEVEGVDDTGAYKTTELKLATKRKLQFSTNDITPEAFELTFGLKGAITSGAVKQLFESGNDSIEVWAYVDLTDAYRSETGLASFPVRGTLSLQNPLEAKSDPAQADYELSVKPNSLNEFTEGSLVPATQGGGED